MKLLDLFCGAGGAAVGYYMNRTAKYIYRFVQGRVFPTIISAPIASWRKCPNALPAG